MDPQRTALHDARGPDPCADRCDRDLGEAEVAAAVGIGSVGAAWLVVQTVFTVRYARLYYLNGSSGIDFNQDDTQPAYVDFAYLPFTIGMTYQVSDTDLKARTIRATALHLLSFVLGR